MHPSGNFLLSSSNDGTLKVWDLFGGYIMYTLYGHEGATTATNFSPLGDNMISGRVDNNVMIWTSPFEGYQGEKLEGIDVTMQKEPKKGNMKESFANVQQDVEQFGSRGNQSMNIEVEDR